MKTSRYKQKKRGRLEALNEILNLSMNGLKKTHIMYRANLSHSQLEKFLEMLTEKELLNHEYDHYITTDKGREYVKAFKELQKILEKVKPIEIMTR